MVSSNHDLFPQDLSSENLVLDMYQVVIVDLCSQSEQVSVLLCRIRFVIDLLLRGIDGNKVLSQFVKPRIPVEEQMFHSDCDSVVQWITSRIAHARVISLTIAASSRPPLLEHCCLYIAVHRIRPGGSFELSPGPDLKELRIQQFHTRSGEA